MAKSKSDVSITREGDTVTVTMPADYITALNLIGYWAEMDIENCTGVAFVRAMQKTGIDPDEVQKLADELHPMDFEQGQRMARCVRLMEAFSNFEG